MTQKPSAMESVGARTSTRTAKAGGRVAGIAPAGRPRGMVIAINTLAVH
jgi:hypothetical protein